ncbi:uncharacterized protein TRAVEDRAFT_132785 [Trametes versicolor FP-101664 SS1]|uniref:uncharacterized protein n=1 Tax=Trametes versicolor (strain FP-101664) TaxID=717944 RepID=UPI0004623298|nr:uncharacterized protein TRAVEDRAFT_132785 [Trametes versicolor FP-101664 SS1]EIW54256.1 hypothetical protein TRAVEDRAFT_132785 [Trametes versicolor FP-101664 SS1]
MPASYLLFSTLAIFLFVAVVSFVIDTAHDSLVSLCDLPGMMHLPFCPTIPSWSADNPILHHVDYPGLVKVQNSLLDDLVGQSASGQVLALNVKHAELAVRDLIGLVRASNLTGRDALADALSGFVSDAQLTGRGLQQLSAKIHGTVDSIAAFNTHAYYTISSNGVQGASYTNGVLARTFQVSTDALAAQVGRVLVAASTSALDLDRLEETLTIIHELCAREAILQHIVADDLLWNLWTLVGLNRAKLRDLKRRGLVLKEVKRFRNLAVGYVAATTQALQVADAELLELRDRLADASVGMEDIPVEVQLASIERMLWRLKVEGSRVRADQSVARAELD